MSVISTGSGRLKRSLGGTSLMTRVPTVYLAVARRRYGDRVINQHTDVMIEGFPRSANTFTVTAFRSAQTRSVVVAHHLHSAAHVRAAARQGVPVLFLVRRPQDAVTSVLVRKPALDAHAVMSAWVDLHQQVQPVVGRLVVASFEQVTSDLGRVIDRVNERYGTSFGRFVHDQAHVDACFARIDADHRARRGSVDERVVARPSEKHGESRTLADRAVAELGGSEAARRAEGLYDQYLGHTA
jgi:hypothetical protein